MIKLLQFRALLISAMFGLFGNALSKLLVIEEITDYYTPLASLIGLVVTLLVSFLLRGRWSRGMKNYVKITCLLFFIGLIIALYMHTKFVMNKTFAYSDFDDNVSYYVKGDEYTPLASKVMRENPNITSNEILIRDFFATPKNKDRVWTEQSIDENKLKLISSYCLVVMCFVGIISILLEVLNGRYGKKAPEKHSTKAVHGP